MHEHYFCSNCGYTGDPLVRPAGNAYVELLLWLIPIIFLINAKYPFLWLVALAYSIWRRSFRIRVCPQCESKN